MNAFQHIIHYAGEKIEYLASDFFFFFKYSFYALNFTFSILTYYS